MDIPQKALLKKNSEEINSIGVKRESLIELRNEFRFLSSDHENQLILVNNRKKLKVQSEKELECPFYILIELTQDYDFGKEIRKFKKFFSKLKAKAQQYTLELQELLQKESDD